MDIAVADINLFAVRSFHGSPLFLDDRIALFHSSQSKGLNVFFLKREQRAAICIIDAGDVLFYRFDGVLSFAPSFFELQDNSDGSVSLVRNGLFLSARLDGSFAFVRRNRDWEHFFLQKATVIPVEVTERSWYKQSSSAEHFEGFGDQHYFWFNSANVHRRQSLRQSLSLIRHAVSHNSTTSCGKPKRS